MLLDKLPPAMIQLEPERVGAVVPQAAEVVAARKKLALEAELTRRHAAAAATEAKAKMKGRRKASRRHRRQQLNVVDEKRMVAAEKQRIRERMGMPARERPAAARDGAGGAGAGRAPAAAAGADSAAAVPSALRRFVR